MNIQTKDLDVFFAFIGTHINTNASMPDNKQTLWMALEVCKFSALCENRDTLDIGFFNYALSASNLNSLAQRQDTIGQFAQALLTSFEHDPISASMPIQIQEQMKEFFYQPEYKAFSFWHISKAMNYAWIGLVLTLSYYAFTQAWWLGLLVFICIPSTIGVTRMLRKLSFLKQKLIVQKTLKKEVQHQPNTYKLGLRHIEALEVGSALYPHFYNLQKQILMFSQIYPAKRLPDNLYMEQDVLKMNNEHLPRLINEYKNRPISETEYKAVSKVVDTMTLVVQDHIADLVWENEHELNSTYRYWLNKVSGERFDAFRKQLHEKSLNVTPSQTLEMEKEVGRQQDA